MFKGVSIYFLNKKPSPIHGIKYPSELTSLFSERPKGFTPLPRVLNQVLDENAKYLNEKKLLLLICTDGEPTDDHGMFMLVFDWFITESFWIIV